MEFKVGQHVMLSPDISEFRTGRVPGMGSFSECAGKIVKISEIDDWGDIRIVSPNYHELGSDNWVRPPHISLMGTLKREGRWKLIANIKSKIDRWSRKLA